MSKEKISALIAAIVTGFSSFVAWVMTIPPEQQTKLLSPLVELIGIENRDAVGLFMRTLASISTVYAVFKSSQSGTNLPLPTPPPTP